MAGLERLRRRHSGLLPVIAALLVASGCAGSAARTLPPEDQERAKGSASFMQEKFRLYADWGPAIRVTVGEEGRVRPGKVWRFFGKSDWPPLSKGTSFLGELHPGLYQGKPAAFVLLTIGVHSDATSGLVCLCAIAPIREDGWIEEDLAFRPVKKLWEGCDAGNF